MTIGCVDAGQLFLCRITIKPGVDVYDEHLAALHNLNEVHCC